VLLNGMVRPSKFVSAIGRSLLDLPVDGHHSLLDLWRAHGAIHVAYARLERLPVRVATATNALAPSLEGGSLAVGVTVERDRSELRGTGGVLYDIAESYADGDFIAVANANQVLTDSLSHLLASLETTGGDVALLAHGDGTPSGLLLARCGSLRSIPPIGFIDLKEQALPALAEHSSVRVVRREQPAALPVRTASDYIAALRFHYNGGADHPQPAEEIRTSGPFAEAWSPVFSLCERGSQVEPSARLHDSVVLRGGRVQRGAVVARSVICAGAVVRKDQVVVDQLVTAAGMFPAEATH
jgi:hypothetical protein